MLTQLALTVPFFAFIAIGFIFGKKQNIGLEGLRWLNFFLVYVLLPALFFQLLSKTPVEQLSNWGFIASTTASTYIVFALSFVIGYFYSKSNIGEATLQGVLGAYSNIGYMGPGLTSAVLGSAATVPTALVFCFDNALIFILVPLLTSFANQNNIKLQELSIVILKKIFLHPFIIATLLGVGAAILHIQMPAPLDKTLELAKNAAAPCALFAMGVTLALTPFQGASSDVFVHLLIKMVVHPVLVYGILNLTGNYDPLWVKTAVLMASLPPALNVYILAQNSGFYVGKAASGVVIGTILSLVTVNILIFYMI